MSRLVTRSLFTYCLVSSCSFLTVNGQSSVFAQIVPDKTTATQVNGNAIAPVGAGTVNGGNLYHSFDQLNVPNSGVVFNTGNSTVDGTKINNILNRVTGDTPSQILGTIESRQAFPNANVFLMNPNGVVFGKDAKLDIGGSFNVNTGTSIGFEGDRVFSVDKASLDFPSGNPQNIKFAVSQPAAIINQGNLSVDAGKSISFTAGAVVNSGVLTAPSGNVALTSVSGGSVVDLRSPDSVLGLSVVKDAVPVNWNGTISSLPKLAELLTGKAQQGDRVVVKPDGTLAIVATPAANELPVTNGTTVVSGNINVSSPTSQGGNVGVFGDRVALINSQITANSGNVLIGGDLQGKGVVPNAKYAYVDNKSIVDVSALQNGNGGKAIIWSDRTTQFFGTILSKGGLLSGDGGFVEVSGKENLLYSGNVNTSAINGNFGTLLLDPFDIKIDVPPLSPSDDDVQLDQNVPIAKNPAFAIFFNDGDNGDGGFLNFVISNTKLNAATSNIILQARNDINVNASVSVAAANINFTAQAGNNINVNQNITTNGGAIDLRANDRATTPSGTGSVQFTNPSGIMISSNGGSINLSGNVLLNDATRLLAFGTPTGGAINLQNANINGTQNLTLDAGTGAVILGSIGSTNKLGTLTVNGDSILANNAIAANNISFTTTGNITTQLLNTSQSLGINAGNISVQSTNGNVTIASIDASTQSANAGNITIIANRNLLISGLIDASVPFAFFSSVNSGSGGNVSLTSTNGNISVGSINTAAVGNTGNVTIQASGDIKTTSFYTFSGLNLAIGTFVDALKGVGNAGKVTLISVNGAIDTSSGNIFTATSNGIGGNITFQAANSIKTFGLFTFTNPSGNAGNISLTSTNGNVDIASIGTDAAGVGNAGNVTVQANGNITTTGKVAINGVDYAIAAFTGGTTGTNNGGNISLTSNNGAIDVSSGRINTSTTSGTSGSITFKATGNIKTGVGTTPNPAIASFVSTGVTGIPNSINFTSTNGAINTSLGDVDAGGGNITFTSKNNITTSGVFSRAVNGGAISLTSQAGAIATGDLTTSGSNNGGNIIVNAKTQIHVGRVDSRGFSGNGGNVILDPIGNVTFTNIDATGFTNIEATGDSISANGGNIKIVSTGGNVLGTGISSDTYGSCGGSTICTNGTGTISIQHGITSPFDPNAFLVGGAITNGTFGTIVAGGAPLSRTPVPNGAGFFRQGNISISPGQGLITPPPVVTPPTTTETPPPVITPPTTSTRTPPTTTETPRITSTRTSPNSTTTTVTPINPILIVTNAPIVATAPKIPVNISGITNQKAGELLALGRFDDAFNEMEKGHLSEYENYLGETLTPQIKNIEQLQQELEEISKQTGSATTVVYPLILGDRLELLIIPPKGTGKPFREFVTDAKESELTPIIQDFANNVRDVSSQDYLEQSQKLYDWLVRPYRDRLQAMQNSQKNNDTQINRKQSVKPNATENDASITKDQTKEKLIPTLVFVMDGGLRVIPVAALHDGKQFLVEKYALANLPYLRATRLESRDRKLNNILAMGLTESVQGFSALPSVKIEVSTISSKVLAGDTYLDKEFTVSNLQEKRRQGNFTVLHLATHAQFISDTSKGSFIQFWNERLSVDRIPSLRFDRPLIEMLTLSACQTAVGQNLGLGGLSVSSGAKSVLASLWEVSDTGTAPLMIQFYNSFPEDITKAIALQKAQVDILQGKVTIKDGKIIGIPKLPAIPLSKGDEGDVNLKHPFFWSSFILIGNWL